MGGVVFVIDNPNEKTKETSGNFCSFITWKRMNLIFVFFIGIAGLQGLVQLSYSSTFGKYSYIFTVVLFVAGEILGYYVTLRLSD